MAAASQSTARKAKGAALRYGCRSNLPRSSGRPRQSRPNRPSPAETQGMELEPNFSRTS